MAYRVGDCRGMYGGDGGRVAGDVGRAGWGMAGVGDSRLRNPGGGCWRTRGEPVDGDVGYTRRTMGSTQAGIGRGLGSEVVKSERDISPG